MLREYIRKMLARGDGYFLSGLIAVIFILATGGSLKGQNYHNADVFKFYKPSSNDLSEELADLVRRPVFMKTDPAALAAILKDRKEFISIRIPLNRHHYRRVYLKRQQLLHPALKISLASQESLADEALLKGFLSYSGIISGDPESLVSISFSANGVVGIVHIGNESYVIGALNYFTTATGPDELPALQAAGKNNLYVLYAESRLEVDQARSCQSPEGVVPGHIRRMLAEAPPELPNIDNAGILEANLALTAGYGLYQALGSAEKTAGYLLSLAAVASTVYEKRLKVRLRVPLLYLVDTPAAATAGNASADQSLESYRKAIHDLAKSGIDLGGIDMAHCIDLDKKQYFAAADIGQSGIAYNRILGGQSGLPLFSRDSDLLVHTIGHSLGAPHTDLSVWSPAIDSCDTETELSYFWTSPLLAPGTIMRNCPSTSGRRTLHFHPRVAALLRASIQQGQDTPTAQGAGLATKTVE